MTIIFEFDGATAQVMKLKYGSHERQATTEHLDELLIVEIKADQKEMQDNILKWTTDQTTPYKGKFIYYATTENAHAKEKPLKTVNFDGGHLVDYGKALSTIDNSHLVRILHINAKKIEIRVEGGKLKPIKNPMYLIYWFGAFALICLRLLDIL